MMRVRVAFAALQILLLLAVRPVGAQTALLLDGSLPNGRTDDLVASQPGPVYTIDDSLGEARAGNLFHSFLDFSVGGGDTARFTSSQPFDRVLVRVTGGQRSDIRGTLRSEVMGAGGSGADFFLLNPAGILFAGGAAIDVPGSLFLSTSHTLRFDDGAVLDLVSAADPVLSIATPESFGFLGGSPAAEIALVDETGAGLALSVPAGESLATIAGQIRIEGTSSSFATVDLTGGELALVATGSAAAEVDALDYDVTTPTPEQLGLIRVATNASLDGVDFTDPNADQGRLVIRGGRLEMRDLAAAQFSGDGSSDAAIDVEVSDAIVFENAGFVGVGTQGATPGGDLVFDADRVELRGLGSGVFSQSAGSGGGAHLQITANRLDVAEGAVIWSTGGAGNPSGSIDLDATRIEISGMGSQIRLLQEADGSPPPRFELGTSSGELLVRDGGSILSQTRAAADGARVEIDTGRLEVIDGGRIESSTTAGASGTAGAIEIEADEVSVTRTNAAATPGLIVTASEAGSLGDAGNLVVRTGTLDLSEGGQLSTTTEGRDAGAIDLVATDEVTLRGDDGGTIPSGLFSRALASSNGSGGEITVRAPRIQVLDGATISSQTRSVGGSGDIVLVADESITIDGSGSFSSTISSRTFLGLGGDVTLDAPSVVVSNGGLVDLTTESSQAGGLLRVEADELIVRGRGDSAIGPSTLAATTRGDGNAQGVEIDADLRIDVSGGGRITSRSEGSGQAGDLALTTADLTIENGGQLETRATSTADAGDIRIDAASDISIQDRSTGEVSVTTEAALGLGGNISLDAGRQITLTRTGISASVGAGSGNGGNVTISAPLLVQNASSVTAQAALGNGGDIGYQASVFVPSADSTIDASSQFGLDGEVSQTSPAEDLSGQVATVGARLVDPTERLRRDCVKRDTRSGSLVVRGAPDTTRFDDDTLLPGAPLDDAVEGLRQEVDPCGVR